jgi:hypothetical protein
MADRIYDERPSNQALTVGQVADQLGTSYQQDVDAALEVIEASA